MDFPENVTRLCGRKRFSFACHPEVSCFTECCRELDLALSPYDVLCLRQELKLSSAEFLYRYVLVEEDAQGGFPKLYLAMVDGGRATCPFITAKGCRVYRSRPGPCRAYPVGRGVTMDPNGVVREIHVLVREPHCRGFSGPGSQNVAEWFENQGLIEYNTLNDELLSLLQHDQVGRHFRLTREQQQDFLLALYKLDEFRTMVSGQAFQAKYRLSEAHSKAVLADDISLLRYGMRWLKELFFAEKI